RVIVDLVVVDDDVLRLRVDTFNQGRGAYQEPDLFVVERAHHVLRERLGSRCYFYNFRLPRKKIRRLEFSLVAIHLLPAPPLTTRSFTSSPVLVGLSFDFSVGAPP